MKDATIFLFLQTRILTLIAGVVVLLFLLRLGNSFAGPAHTSRALLAGFFSVLRTHVMLLLYAAVVAHDASQRSIPESLNLSNIFILFHLRDFHLLLSLFFRLIFFEADSSTDSDILNSSWCCHSPTSGGGLSFWDARPKNSFVVLNFFAFFHVRAIYFLFFFFVDFTQIFGCCPVAPSLFITSIHTGVQRALIWKNNIRWRLSTVHPNLYLPFTTDVYLTIFLEICCFYTEPTNVIFLFNFKRRILQNIYRKWMIVKRFFTIHAFSILLEPYVE